MVVRNVGNTVRNIFIHTLTWLYALSILVRTPNQSLLHWNTTNRHCCCLLCLSIHIAVQLEDIRHTFLLGLLHHTESKVFKDTVVTILNGETCCCRGILSIGRKRICLCSSCSVIDNCKSTNSNRRTLEISCKRLYFNQIKEQLVHFNGTVVTKNKEQGEKITKEKVTRSK